MDCPGLGKDTDGDGCTDAVDHDGRRNPADDDRDGIVDYNDFDLDGDGTLNRDEQGDLKDIDGDGVLNPADLDVDNDGYGNGEDRDIDGDGVLNGHDDDMDGDGTANS
jgi:hypothetical protein